MHKIWPFMVGGFLISTMSFAQEEEIDLFALSLEELMNVEIVSASKKTENLFDAPVSSYTITRSEIAKSGVTSIPEALRLCPGVIVRETTNGNYDIHIRGYDNLIRYTESFTQANLLTLVMVDDRPVFNYNLGGTVWESLAIDLVDIERIEIVRGPAASLFGPNAVTGVVNIITRKAKDKGAHYAANLQYGIPQSIGANVAVGHKFSQLDVTVSANYQQRDRSDDLQYVYKTNRFEDKVENLPNAGVADYSGLERSLEKLGINGFVHYQPQEALSFSLATGWQRASAQRVYYNFDITALNTSNIERQYINLKSAFHDLSLRVSYTSGIDNAFQGFQLVVPQYNISNADAMLDYQWKVNSKLSIRPEVSYQRVTVDDRSYTVNKGMIGLVNGRVSNYTLAGSLRADYHPIDDLRLIGAVRMDKFRVPDRAYLSYQLAATYKVEERFVFRAVQARATSGAFVSNYFLNVPPISAGTNITTTYSGNPNMDVASNLMTEVGMRMQVSNLLQVDLALFQQEIKDLSYPENTALNMNPDGTILVKFQYNNLPLKARQRGITLSANLVPHQRFHVKPFVTVQKTTVDYQPLEDENHRSTPTFYGGAYLNYMAHRKLNLNLNLYYYDQHTLYHRKDLERPTAVGEIAGKLLANTKVSYQVASKFNTYVNVRNLLGDNSREYYGTDRIGRSYWLGASYNF